MVFHFLIILKVRKQALMHCVANLTYNELKRRAQLWLVNHNIKCRRCSWFFTLIHIFAGRLEQVKVKNTCSRMTRCLMTLAWYFELVFASLALPYALLVVWVLGFLNLQIIKIHFIAYFAKKRSVKRPEQIKPD